jgi:hypothetical protein
MMRSSVHHLSVSAVRADALFVSALQRSEEPGAAAVRTFGGRGCAERVSQEFGDHPELAAAWLRWARTAADDVFRRPGSGSFPAQLAAPSSVALARAGRAA